MDPILGLVGSIGGGLINNLFAGQRQDEQQKFAAQQAQIAMATQEANFRTNRQTAYQDTMSDMKAAGLNPILAYSQGASGGGSPSATAATSSQAPVSDVGIGAGINSALAIRQQNQDLANKQAQEKLTQQQTKSEEQTTIMKGTDNIKNTWSLDKAWQDYKEAENQNNWIASNPGLASALHQAGYAIRKGGEAAKPILDAIPFLGSSSKSTNQPAPPSFKDRWPSGRPDNQPSSARTSANSNRFKNTQDEGLQTFQHPSKGAFGNSQPLF